MPLCCCDGSPILGEHIPAMFPSKKQQTVKNSDTSYYVCNWNADI